MAQRNQDVCGTVTCEGSQYGAKTWWSRGWNMIRHIVTFCIQGPLDKGEFQTLETIKAHVTITLQV